MNGLDAARNRLAVLHDHLSRREVALAADDLHAILSAILDHLEAHQTDASIRRGLDDVAAGRTEYLGRFTDDEPEPEPDYGPRPAGCCGTCPPILGGGYDCTCADNPRCDANKADRLDCDGDRWVWDYDAERWTCITCITYGIRHDVDTIARVCEYTAGPLTFAPRPAEPPATAPLPDPLDNSNHADRYDGDGDWWVWCDECDGFRQGHYCGEHRPGLGVTAVWIDERYGPLTFAPEPVEEVSQAEKLATAIEEAAERYREEDGPGGTIHHLSFRLGMLHAAKIVLEVGK